MPLKALIRPRPNQDRTSMRYRAVVVACWGVGIWGKTLVQVLNVPCVAYG
jgi:hypothetical protein